MLRRPRAARSASLSLLAGTASALAKNAPARLAADRLPPIDAADVDAPVASAAAEAAAVSGQVADAVVAEAAGRASHEMAAAMAASAAGLLEVQPFSIFLPPPYRVLLLLSLGILCWATNVHVLRLLGLDPDPLLQPPGRAAYTALLGTGDDSDEELQGRDGANGSLAGSNHEDDHDDEHEGGDHDAPGARLSSPGSSHGRRTSSRAEARASLRPSSPSRIVHVNGNGTANGLPHHHAQHAKHGHGYGHGHHHHHHAHHLSSASASHYGGHGGGRLRWRERALYMLAVCCAVWALVGWYAFRVYTTGRWISKPSMGTRVGPGQDGGSDGGDGGDPIGRHAQMMQGVIMLGALVALCWPGDALFRSTRKAFGRQLLRILSPSLSQRITFADVLLADVLTSFAKVFGDVWLTVCFLLPRREHHTWPNGRGSVVVPLLASLPYAIRLRQCLSEYYTSDPMTAAAHHGADVGASLGLGAAKPRRPTRPLWNAAKYASAFPVIWFSALQSTTVTETSVNGLPGVYNLWLISVLVNSLFSFWWDVTNDWGLEILKPSTWSARSKSWTLLGEGAGVDLHSARRGLLDPSSDVDVLPGHVATASSAATAGGGYPSLHKRGLSSLPVGQSQASAMASAATKKHRAPHTPHAPLLASSAGVEGTQVSAQLLGGPSPPLGPSSSASSPAASAASHSSSSAARLSAPSSHPLGMYAPDRHAGASSSSAPPTTYPPTASTSSTLSSSSSSPPSPSSSSSPSVAPLGVPRQVHRRDVSSSSWLLRGTHQPALFSPAVYQTCVLLDLVLRFLWSLKLSPHLHHVVELEAGVFLLEALEIVRRWMWVFLRVEWEAVKRGAWQRQGEVVAMGVMGR